MTESADMKPPARGKATFVDWDHARYPYLGKVVWQQGGPLTLVGAE